LGDYQEAGEDADHAIRLDPDNALPYFNRGRSYYYRDDYEAAEQDLSKAIELDRHHAASWRWRGRTRAERKQFRASLEDFNRAVEIAPKEAIGYCWRAGVHAMQDDNDAALLDINSALSLDPDNAEYYAHRGLVRWYMKQVDRAFRDFEQAIRLDSKCFYAFGYRAEAHFRCGHLREALDDCERVLELCPDEADTLAIEASIWSVAPQAEIRDGARAVRAATRACELTQWKDAGNLRVLGAAYAENGDFKAAAAWETTAARLEPDDEDFQAGSKSLLQLYKAGQPYRETGFLTRKPGKEFREGDAAP
jgi:tetratricopeptide (TPR) repeat protein